MNYKIHYLTGDATQPIGEGNKILCHICNDVNIWAKGFVLAINKHWKQPEISYRLKKGNLTLGNVDFIRVENDIIVANMIAQNGIVQKDNQPLVNYNALRICLTSVNDMAFQTHSTIHMPRIGVGLGKGDWNIIEKIISEVMSVNVYVYDLK
jgi:hypothetical protein